MTATDTFLGLLRAVLTDRDDDLPRVLLADWFEENGEPERAACIRWMCWRPTWFGDATCLEHSDYSPGYVAALGWLKGGPADREIARTLPGAWGHSEGRWVWHRRRKPDGAAVQFSRGFVSALTCSAADWLRVESSLYWRPEQTAECPKCRGHGHFSKGNDDYNLCPDERDGRPSCDGTGRVPREMPATAQPLTKVTLTAAEVLTYWDWPGLVWADDGRTKFTCDRWPGIAFTPPAAS